MKVEVELANFFQLTVTVTDDSKAFAYYLYSGDEIIERTPYLASKQHKFPLDKPGVYRVKCYRKSVDGVVSSTISDRVRYTGFADVPRTTPKLRFSVIGVTKTSAFAAHVLSINHDVVCFVDPSGEQSGINFFDVPVVNEVSEPVGVTRVGHEAYARDFSNLQKFTLANGSVDLLSKELHRFSVMELYRLSRKVYLEGLVEGAYYIQTFIFNKFNCRVPFKARIGDGTRLGIGGIGTVIHPDSVIGRDCVIAQNVTLGGRVRGNGTPIVGNNVFIAPGAKCFGGRIGSNVVIGANSVVLDEIPDNCVVAGVPARIISRDIERYTDYTARPAR